MSSYSSAQPTGNNANSEALFQKHSQTIATSIQKILQNGKFTFRLKPHQRTHINVLFLFENSIDDESYG